MKNPIGRPNYGLFHTDHKNSTSKPVREELTSLSLHCFMQCSAKKDGGRVLTEAAILYSSTKGSFVKWICNGSSVERETLRPRKKNIGKGFRW